MDQNIFNGIFKSVFTNICSAFEKYSDIWFPKHFPNFTVKSYLTSWKNQVYNNKTSLISIFHC